MSKETKTTKKQLATELFERMLSKREAGEFESNRDFRQACIQAFQDELEVSGSSACTMYNVNKKAAMEADPTLGLGRDPKKEKAKAAPKKKAVDKKAGKVVEEATPEAEGEVPTETVVVETDPTVAVDLDPIASLSEHDPMDDYDDIAGMMGDIDVGGGDYM